METGGMIFLGLVIFCFTLFGVVPGIASWEDSKVTRLAARAAGAAKNQVKDLVK